MAERAFIGLGSNLGHPRRQIANALARLKATRGIRVIDVSPSYVTEAIGGGPQPDYVNAVAEIVTSLAPRALLDRMHAIERRQKRQRSDAMPPNAPRTLDLDLLLYGARRMRTSRVTVPHPRMHERAFVLRPLIDVARAARIPGRGAASAYVAAVRGQRIRRTRASRPTA